MWRVDSLIGSERTGPSAIRGEEATKSTRRSGCDEDGQSTGQFVPKVESM